MCDFNPAAWPPPPHYNGNVLTFMFTMIEWVFLAIGSFIFDLLGGFGMGLSCLVYDTLTAPIGFFYAVMMASIPSFKQFGPWAPIVGALVLSAVVLILVFLILVLYRIVPEQFETDTEQMEGKQPPPTESTSEVGEIASEI